MPYSTQLGEDLPDVAKALCRNSKPAIDLSHLFGQQLDRGLIAELDTWVRRMSDQQYTIEETDDARFALQVSGALYCVRIDQRTRTEQLFILVPTTDGIQFCAVTSAPPIS